MISLNWLFKKWRKVLKGRYISQEEVVKWVKKERREKTFTRTGGGTFVEGISETSDGRGYIDE